MLQDHIFAPHYEKYSLSKELFYLKRETSVRTMKILPQAQETEETISGSSQFDQRTECYIPTAFGRTRTVDTLIIGDKVGARSFAPEFTL